MQHSHVSKGSRKGQNKKHAKTSKHGGEKRPALASHNSPGDQSPPSYNMLSPPSVTRKLTASEHRE